MSDLATIFAVFLLAGLVKGIVGMGLPTVALGLLAAAFGLHAAMALILVPSLVTNLWQAIVGGHLRSVLWRTWSFLLFAMALVFPAAALSRDWLNGAPLLVLGGVLLAYGLSGLTGWRPRISPGKEPVLAATLGVLNGFLTGLTGSFVFPGVMFLQSLDWTRAHLIQAMGVLFSCSTLALAVSLFLLDRLELQTSFTSALATLPALGGMVAGQAIRQRLPDRVFRMLFFLGLCGLGASLILDAAT